MARKKKEDNALLDMIAAMVDVLPAELAADLLADYEASLQPQPHHEDYPAYDSGPVYQPTRFKRTTEMLEDDLAGLDYLEEIGS
jgi:hypothetical protein